MRNLPEYNAAKKNVISATVAWKTYKMCQVGASAVMTPIGTRQRDSSNMSLIRSNSGPMSNAPAIDANPIQMYIIDISAVLLDVRTSMAGSVV